MPVCITIGQVHGLRPRAGYASSFFWVKGRTLAAALIDGSPKELGMPFPFVPNSPK
jgi:hypothetical protein